MRTHFSTIVAAVLLLTSSVHAAPTDRDSYQEAVDEAAARRYQAAIADFQGFITSSVGDARIEKAQKQLRDCTIALAKQYEISDREIDACYTYLGLAADAATPEDAREGYRKQAAGVLTTAFADAQKKNLPDKQLQLHQAWFKYFPERATLLTQDQIEKLTVDAAANALQDKLTLLDFPDVLQQYFGTNPPMLDAIAKRNRTESPLNLYFKSLSDLGWTGRYVAEIDRIASELPLKNDKAFITQTDRLLLRRAEAWCAQGNLAEVRAAIDAGKAAASDPGVNLLKALEQKFAAKLAAAKPERPALEFPSAITGKGSWADKGDGWGPGKDVVLEEGADVTVRPGFFLDGGKIEIMAAALHLQGTPAQPIVFKHVTISVNNGAHVDIDNALFIDCTFRHTGKESRFPHASRFTVTNAMFYRSRFSSLKRNDFGIKFSNSIFVESYLGERDAEGSDLASAYNGRWDQIDGCLFYRSRLAPSAIWMTSKCNFIRSTVGKSCEFRSKTTLSVPLWAQESDPMIGYLRNNSTLAGLGDLRFGYPKKPFDLNVPNFWPLLPAESAELPKPPAPTTAPAATAPSN